MSVDQFLVELGRWVGAGMASCLIAKVFTSVTWAPILWFKGMVP
ncbi:MAG: hypothetical protein ACFCBV_07250 [Phycisphaerales bacterium]